VSLSRGSVVAAASRCNGTAELGRKAVGRTSPTSPTEPWVCGFAGPVGRPAFCKCLNVGTADVYVRAKGACSADLGH
jgi:hypothetical protein